MRTFTVLALVAVATASFAQVMGVSRDCQIRYDNFAGNGGDVVAVGDTLFSPTTFGSNFQTFGHTDSVSGVDRDGVPYYGIVSSNGNQSVAVTLAGGLNIAGSNTAQTAMDGFNTLRIAQNYSTIRYRFTVATATSFTLFGHDTQNRILNEVRIDQVGGPNIYRTFFDIDSFGNYSETGILAAGTYDFSASASSVVGTFGGPDFAADSQVQTFSFSVGTLSSVPGPSAFAAFGLGALVSRRRARRA